MQDSGFLNVPDARLYYEVAGAGPAMVFVHGFTFDTRMWDDQWSVFTASDMAWPFSIPALAFAKRDVMAPMGLPGARRGMKKLNVAATKTTRNTCHCAARSIRGLARA
jgi:hypothetical protein